MAKRRPAAGNQIGPLWSVPVSAADIPETGRKLEVAADAATRAAVAKAADVVGIPRLELSVELVRHGRDGIQAVGQVVATVEQNCVVSLEPMQTEIVEPFDLLFLPPAVADPDAAKSDTLDHGDADPPETLQDGVADLGALAAEFVILGIDPYPRKPGAEFAPPAADDAASRPFAALAALKPRS